MSNAIEQRLAALAGRESQLEAELRDVRIRLSELRALVGPNGAAPAAPDAPSVPRGMAPRGAREAAVKAVFEKNPNKALSNMDVRTLAAKDGFPHKLDAQNVSPILKALAKAKFVTRSGTRQDTKYTHKP